MNQSYRNIKVLYPTFLIIVLMLPQVLQSQQLLKTSQSINIYDLCATSIMTPELLENARLNTLKLYPDIAEAELERPDWLKKGLAATIGDSLQFWAFNIRQSTSYRIWAELRATGSTVAIWVEKDELNNGTVTDDFVAELIDIFENSTPAGSINSSSGLIPIEREIFGDEPNKDGDGKTDILLLDIQDFYDGESNRTFVSGFFNPNDQRDNSETGVANSNERDLLYLDTDPGIAQKAMLTTASHEYQHLIHYNYDQSETNLINEGASQLAQIVTGFTWDNPGSFFNDTDRGLFFWGELSDPDILADYAKAQMWMLYLWDQFGQEFVKSLVQDPQSGKNSLVTAIGRTGSGLSFNDVLQNWFIANYLNDTSVNPVYGYSNEKAKTVKAALKSSTNNYPANASDALSRYAAEYVRFKNGTNLTGQFSGNGLTVLAINLSNSSVDVVEVPVGAQYTDDKFGVDHSAVVFALMNDTGSNLSYTYTIDAFSPYFVREIKYDDGFPDIITGTQTVVWWGTNKPRFGWGVKFSPLNDESFLLGLKAHVLYSSNFMGSPNFLLKVFDDSGPDGKPGRELIPTQHVTLPSTADLSWWEYDLSEYQDSLSKYKGDYYISLEHPPGDTNAFFVAVDDSEPATNHSWALVGAASETRQPGWYSLAEFTLGDDNASLEPFDLMYRALVSYIDHDNPVFTPGFLQHPVFTENFDIYVVGKSELNESKLSGTLTIGGTEKTLNFTPSGATDRVFVDNSVTITVNGLATISISGTNKYGFIEGDTVLNFSVQGVEAGVSSKISSPSGSKTLIISDFTSARKVMFFAIDGVGFSPVENEVIPELKEADRIDRPVTFGPSSISGGTFQLQFNYSSAILGKKDPDNLAIGRLQNGEWIVLPSIVDKESNTVYSETGKLGTFQLFWLRKPASGLPVKYELYDNYPNPFNMQTILKFSIANDDLVTLKIYNVLGEEIRTLRSEYMSAGIHIVEWDGKNNLGMDVSTGVYLYHLKSGEFTNVKKMIIIK